MPFWQIQHFFHAEFLANSALLLPLIFLENLPLFTNDFGQSHSAVSIPFMLFTKSIKLISYIVINGITTFASIALCESDGTKLIFEEAIHYG